MKNQAQAIEAKIKEATDLLGEAMEMCDGLRRDYAHRSADGFFEVNGIRRSITNANRTLARAKRQATQYGLHLQLQAKRRSGSQRGK